MKKIRIYFRSFYTYIKEKIEIAKSILKEKLPLETISRCTNLTIEEINNLN